MIDKDSCGNGEIVYRYNLMVFYQVGEREFFAKESAKAVGKVYRITTDGVDYREKRKVR